MLASVSKSCWHLFKFHDRWIVFCTCFHDHWKNDAIWMKHEISRRNWKTMIINQSIGVPSLRRGWRSWCAIRFCQVPSHCTVPYSFSSSRSRCQSNSFFFVLCLFFHPTYSPTLIFVRNDAFLQAHNRPVSFSWYSKQVSYFSGLTFLIPLHYFSSLSKIFSWFCDTNTSQRLLS